MIITCCQTPKPMVQLKRIRREVEAKRLEHVRRVHEAVKKIAKDEIEHLKSFIPQSANDDEEISEK
jgi:hypothetical protein